MIKRRGYKNFIGLMIELFRINRNCRKLRAKTQLTITLPVGWIK